MSERIVITGIGLVTSIGIGVKEFWNACLQGTSGVNRITAFDPSGFATQIAAEVKDFMPASYLPPKMFQGTERVHQIGLVAALLAMDDSGLDLELEDKTRVVTCVGSANGEVLIPEERLMALYHHDRKKSTAPISESKPLVDQVSDFLDIKGPAISFSTACSSGNHAIGWAFNTMRLGKADVAIAGGAEASILPLITAGFCALRVMSRRNNNPQGASRPFDLERDGFVLGEGAAFLVLENLDHARKRNASIYAEIVGYSMTGDAYHMVMPDPRANEVSNAMKLALEDASIDHRDVDYINAHGTSTIRNDAQETRAIKALFGARAYEIPISATKSMIGHTIGAAGAIELAVCALAIRDGVIPPTINYETPDPECDLDYVPNVARECNVRVALSNSFGFGGNNSSIVLKKSEPGLGRRKSNCG